MSEPPIPTPHPSDGAIPVEVDPDLMDLVPHFLENRRNEVETLRSAVRAKDTEAIGDVAHRMKGLGGYGFDYITEVGIALERIARSGNLEAATPWIDGLADYLARIEPREGPQEG